MNAEAFEVQAEAEGAETVDHEGAEVPEDDEVSALAMGEIVIEGRWGECG